MSDSVEQAGEDRAQVAPSVVLVGGDELPQDARIRAPARDRRQVDRYRVGHRASRSVEQAGPQVAVARGADADPTARRTRHRCWAGPGRAGPRPSPGHRRRRTARCCRSGSWHWSCHQPWPSGCGRVAGQFGPVDDGTNRSQDVNDGPFGPFSGGSLANPPTPSAPMPKHVRGGPDADPVMTKGQRSMGSGRVLSTGTRLRRRCRRHRPAGQRRSRQLAERAPLGAAGPRGRSRHRRIAHHRAAASRGPPRPRPDADPGRCRPRGPLADRRCRRAAARHHPAVPGRRGAGGAKAVAACLAVFLVARRRSPGSSPSRRHGPAAAVTGRSGAPWRCAWARSSPGPLHLAPHPNQDDALAAEAAWLLTRLEGLATEMRAGFDPATSAEHVLDALPSAGARVARRSPHRRPDRPTGPPRAARVAARALARPPRRPRRHRRRLAPRPCGGGRPRRRPSPARDAAARRPRRGSTASSSVTAWAASVPPADLLDATSAVARQHQGLIAVALAFGGLRERAGIEERERLARQIHDGIAQELVALGFRVDRLKRLPRRASCGPRSPSCGPR